MSARRNYRSPTIPRHTTFIPAKAGISRAIALRRQWRRQQCNIHQQSPVPHKTIPAKAGISQSCVANNTKIRRYTPVPHTDHSCDIQGDSPPATMAATTMPNPPTIPHSPTKPFLRKQESHSHMLPIIPKSADTLPFPHRPFLRKQESHNCVPPTAASILAAMPPVKMRFLPTQEWSRGERGIGGVFGRECDGVNEKL